MSHAILSASGAHRWLACPPSARYERQFPDDTSPYAEEGTRAHVFAEQRLRNLIAETDPPPATQDMTNDMWDAVEIYVNTVLSGVTRRRDSYIEQRVDITPWVPGGFGTSDFVTFAGDELRIYDLKYGQGVPVSAEGNPQARLYALGALHTLGWLYDVKTVRTTIVQPRLDSESSEVLTVDELLAWGDTVQPIAQQAWDGKGDFQPGEHCRFCKAKAVCRARAEANLALAQHDFRAPADLSTEEVADILRQGQDLEHWLSSVREHALQQALAGMSFPGWKLVEGRSTRRYTDEGAVVEALTGRADFDALTPRKPLGITAMEKELGKGVFRDLLAPHVMKPPGKPTLAPETDKRPAVNTAEIDFREVQI